MSRTIEARLSKFVEPAFRCLETREVNKQLSNTGSSHDVGISSLVLPLYVAPYPFTQQYHLSGLNFPFCDMIGFTSNNHFHTRSSSFIYLWQRMYFTYEQDVEEYKFRKVTSCLTTLWYNITIHKSFSESYRELEPTVFTGLTAYAFHVLYHEVRTYMLDLLPLVASADGDHGCIASEPGADPTRGVFKDDAVGRGEAQLARCKEEWIWRRLSRFQAFVIRSDRHLGRYDTDAGHASEC